MSIPTPPAPPISPKVRSLLYAVLGWLGVAAFLVFIGYGAVPGAGIPTWLSVVNAVLNGANIVFFVAKANVTPTE